MKNTTTGRGALARQVSLLAATALLVSAAGIATAQTSPPPAADTTVHPQQWPAATWPLKRDAALERRVQAILGKLTIEEKVGQIVQADIGSVTPDDVRKYRLGSILAGGNSGPNGHEFAPPSEWLAMADAFHAASMDTTGGHTAVPILFGIDAVHGHNNVVGATLFPHNIGLGAARNPALIGRIARATAEELRATGAEWTFAPTLTVPRDDRWGRTYEGYSEDPRIVASYAAAVVEGLQGKVGSKQFLDETHVMSSAKHFLGDGGTFEGKDQGDTRVSERELRTVHGAPYPLAIHAGVQSVMASFSSWNGVKMHGNHDLLTDVLKGRMNFGGFVVGDWNAHGQVTGCTNEDCAAAFNAGVDMLMAPESWRGYYDSAVRQVKSGEIPMARLDDAVSRILRVKLRLGLFDGVPPSKRALGGKFELIGSAAHRAIARQAVRESLVLLKNQGQLLPLDPRKRILVAGAAADSISAQAGGWTLTWQGTGTKPEHFPNSETIWHGIQSQVAAAGGKAELAIDGVYADKPDVAIVVFGEDPYAEFQGDLPDLQYRGGQGGDLSLLKKLKAAGIPVVSVFLSGRPLWVNREINASDAFVAAWLPGSEGGGVADVLLRAANGKTAHDFTGKLSFSWPRTAVQTPLNVGQPGYDPLFAYGFGLRYADAGNLASLPEVSGVVGGESPTGVYFARGVVSPGGHLVIAGSDGIAAELVQPPLATRDGRLKVTAVDHLAQEDARRFVWSGAGKAGFSVSTQTARDLNRETNGDVLVVATMKVDSIGAGDIWWTSTCGAGCAGRLPIAAELATVPKGRWVTVGVPLKCLRTVGADTGKLESAFGIEATGRLDLSVSRVALGTNPDFVLACATR